MECPSCNIDIELTWKRYLQNPFARFTCPSCSGKFKLKRTLSSYIFYLLWLVSYFGLIILCLKVFQFNNIWLIYSVVTITMITLYAIVDKKMESNFATKLR
jgi:hypothetical protein